MKLTISFLILLFVVSLSEAQTGKIYNAETKEPVAGATIRLKQPGKIIVSDINGSFKLPSNDAKELFITSIGYTDTLVTISNAVKLDIALQPSARELDALIITASRMAQRRGDAPISITRISPRQINETKARDLPELLNKVPGVVMTNLNNEQHSMSIRQPMGSTNAYHLYLEDGIPIRTMGVFNHNALIEINIPAVQSIEVVKGPASSIYGPEAIGGSINFISLKPTTLTTVKAGVQMDNYGYQRYNLTTSGIFSEKLGYAVNVNTTRQRNGWLDNTDFDKLAMTARLDYIISPGTILWTSFTNIDYNTQASGSVDSAGHYSKRYSSATGFTYRKVYAKRLRVTLEQNWTGQNASTLSFYYRDNAILQSANHTIRWMQGSDSAVTESNNANFKSYGVVAQHNSSFNFMNSKLLVGVSGELTPHQFFSNPLILDAQVRPDGLSVEKYTVRSNDPDAYIVNYDADIKNMGAWVQAETSPATNLRLVAGLRYDYFSYDYRRLPTISQPVKANGTRSYDKISPRIGVTYNIGKDKAIFANFSKGFVQANLSTLFNPANPQGIDLKPATFNNIEIGGWASLVRNKLYIDVTLYRLEGQNEVISVRQADNTSLPMAVGETLHQGIEYGINYNVSKQLNIRFGGTNALHRFERFELSKRESDALKNVDGKRIPSSPGFIANTGISYYPNWLKGFRIAAEWQRMSEWYQNQVNTVKYSDRGFLGAKGISLLNMRTGYSFKGVELFLNVYNVTDELYANTASRGNNSNDRSSFNPGAPRIFNFGIQYSFTAKK
jgi:iron complex outermembrane recepter protein